MDFLPDAGVLAAYTLAVALLTLTPGPDMALFVGRTIAGGRRYGFAAFLGTAVGLLAHSFLAAAGLSALLATSESAFAVMKVAGAGYLLWLAIGVLRHGSRFVPDAGGAASGFRRTFITGLAVNLLNPKIVVFFLTFLPQFVQPGDPNAAGTLFFLGVWYIVATLPLTVMMILGAERLSAGLKAHPRAIRVLDWVFAGAMGAFALRILTARAVQP